ncbi:MAG: acyl-CoA dehydrogenase family protein, partial [Planctomycetota bacterium]
MLEYVELSEVEKSLIENAKKFAEKEIRPAVITLDKEHQFPYDIFRKAGRLGYLSMLIPDKYGGTGLGNFPLVLVLEQINKVCAAV